MDMMSDILANNPIVIDQGSYQFKAGFGGDDRPKLMFQSYIGKPKYKPLPMSSAQSDIYIGNQVTETTRGVLKLKYPYQRGTVSNWAEMEQLWKYTFSELKANTKESPLMITEPPYTSYNQKQQTASILFQNQNVPALFFAVSGVLALFASGKVTGIILDCGDTITQSVPIYDGFYLQHAANRIELGGRDVTENLQMLLRRGGYIFQTTSEFEIVRKMKQKRCFLNPQPINDDKFNEERKLNEKYMLPDNSLIDLTFEKQRAPELLMNPERYGYETMSVPEMLYNSIQKSDIEIRRTLYNEVVLTGGSSLLSGFPERLIGEMKKLMPANSKIKIWSPPERFSLSWQGGSILSHLASFKNMWILKKEYEEEGERIFLRKQL